MEHWPNFEGLEKVRHSLEAARRRAIAKEKYTHSGILQPTDKLRIEEALKKVVALCRLYQEVIFERAHSSRVRTITEELDGLVALLAQLVDEPLSAEDEAKVRVRIKTFHHETRAWVGMLPLHPAVGSLSAHEGRPREARIERLKALWKTTEAAWFAPPPREAGGADGVPSWLQIAPVRTMDGKTKFPDPIDATLALDGSGGYRWRCKPRELAELLGFAKEALLLQVDGPDRGGNTTFAQRRLGSQPKDSFAISCVLIYEGVLGLNSAKQSNAEKRSKGLQTDFEDFSTRVMALALGVELASNWAIGVDPIRRAIATSRAWGRLFRAAGCKDAEGFYELPSGDQIRVIETLAQPIRKKLVPEAPPWV